jgi:RNA polymerase sigma factor (sigma-70 family)
MADAAGGDRLSDRQLLERYAALRDAAALELLVRRHSALVWGVCRRVLHGGPDAEDAYQATFLVFLRKAAGLGKREHVGPWLAAVAYRVAVRARANAAKRRLRERGAAPRHSAEASRDVEWRDLRPVLDEEVQRLPLKYRLPFLLCYVEGKTNAEAAVELGCPAGTVLSRLARARQRLRARLTRRGLALSAGGLAAALAPADALSAAPAAFTDSTLKAVLAGAAGKGVAAFVTPTAAALSQGVLRTMLTTKVIAAAAGLFVALAVAGAGAGVAGYRLRAPEVQDAQDPPVGNTNRPANRIRVPAQREGVLAFVGTEVKPGENVPRERLINVKMGQATKQYRRLKEGDLVEEGQLLARVDDGLVRDQWDIAKRKLAVAEADFVAAEKVLQEAHTRWQIMEKRYKDKVPGSGGVPYAEEDVRASKLVYETKVQEAASKREAVEVAKLEVKQAETVLGMCEIRSPVRGTIREITKRRGEAVRNLETVFVIEPANPDD